MILAWASPFKVYLRQVHLTVIIMITESRSIFLEKYNLEHVEYYQIISYQNPHMNHVCHP